MTGSPTAPPPVQILHLSLVVGGRLCDPAGRTLGRVEDLIVRLGDDDHPPITGALVEVAGRRAFLPEAQIADIGHGAVRLSDVRLDLADFVRRPEEVLLRKDVLDRQLISIDGARLVRANEIELARLDGWWRVVGVDTGARGGLRRLLPRALGRRIAAGGFIDWSGVEPFVGHVPSLRLRVPHPKPARLHPADIADLVESASRGQGEEIMDAAEADRQLEADVFEELDERHQVELLDGRDDAEVAQILRRMAPDDAADLVAELSEERRERVLLLLPAAERNKVRALLGYDPARAGGLMSTDFICVYRHASVGEALERVRTSRLPADLLTAVFVMDARKRVEGSVALAALIRAEPDDALVDFASRPTGRLRADADVEEIARFMADYNLTCAPVVDDEDRMIGVITVDDVLEVMLPKGWRRRFGLLGED